MSSYGEKSYFQWIYAGIGLSVFLFLVLLFYSFYYFSQKYVLEEFDHLKYVIELRENIEENNIEEIKKNIETKSYYQEESFQWIPKEQIKERFQPLLADSLNSYLSLPFKDLISFEIKAKSKSRSDLVLIKTDLLKSNYVEDVYYNDIEYDQIKNNTQKVLQVLGTLCILLFFLSILFLYNTINSTVYSKREIIKNQSLLGASKRMIARPFIYNSILTALSSIVLASCLLFLVYNLVNQYLNMRIHPDNNYMISLLLILSFILISVILFTWIILMSRIKFRSK